jgi:CHAT domain-containing protein/tetratricopeptide (TPR) repeat protein
MFGFILRFACFFSSRHRVQGTLLRSLSFLLLLSAGVAQNKDTPTLDTTNPIERELSGGETHSYRITLTNDQYLHIAASQRGIDVGLALFRPDGAKIIEVNTPINAYGPESIFILLDGAGTYRLEVASSDKTAPPGRYEIKIAELRKPTEHDRKRVAAESVFQQAEKLRTEGSANSLKAALVKYNEALPLYRALEDRSDEALTLTKIGMIFNSLSNLQKALDYHKEALTLYSQLKDTDGEALVLSNLGADYYSVSQPKTARDYFEKALPLFVSTGNRWGEAESLDNLGAAYYSVNEGKIALDYFLKALPLRRLVRDRDGEATTLNNLGAVYRLLGEAEKTREYLEQGLVLARAVGNRSNEAAMLFNIADMYSSYGQPRKALEYFAQSLTLRHLTGDLSGEASALTSMGLVYQDIGERQKALELYLQALPLRKAAGDRSREGTTLNNIGGIYDDLGDKRQAIAYYEQAIKLYHEVGDSDAEGLALSNIGGAYNDLGDKQKALSYYLQALPLYDANNLRDKAMTLNNLGVYYNSLNEPRKALDYLFRAIPLYRTAGDRSREGRALTNIAATYGSLGENAKALDHFRLGLPKSRAVEDRSGEAKAYDLLMSFYTVRGNAGLAIFYGKQAVNLYQQLRAKIQGLDKATQKSFLKSIEPSYRKLAELLIRQNRAPEAQQVLNAFKDQQFFDFNIGTTNPLKPVVRSAHETEFGSQFEKALSDLASLDSQIGELQQKLTASQRNVEDASHLEQLEGLFKIASDQFLTLLTRSETDFSQERNGIDKVNEVQDSAEMQSALRQISLETGQKAVAVYTVVTETGFQAVIVSADSVTPVSPTANEVDLKQKALQLWALLQSPDYDPRLLSHELYEVIFKPIELKLPKNTKTIIWSLDDTLRYIPMAALYDGKRYLAERYNHVIFTRAEKERLMRKVSLSWVGYGFSTSKAHTVTVAGTAVAFGPLDFAEDEMQIFRTDSFPDGIIDGQVFSEEQFTKASLLSALIARRPLVHISSHFRFLPGDESQSFLLLGDGDFITLAELKEQANLFQGVELLTLSACDTAEQHPDATGREIDAFAELAQRLGAGSVLASLWPVLDTSTAELMKAFYSNRQRRRQSKSEALRQAQLDLLYGRTRVEPSSTGARTKRNMNSSEEIVIQPKYRVPFKVESNKPFAHPYYWAPFVLYGNWK